MSEPVTILDPGQVCPSCGGKLEAHTDAYGEATAKPGDVAICVYCAELLRFDEQLHVRAVDDLERASLLTDPRVEQAVGAVLTSIATNPEWPTP